MTPCGENVTKKLGNLPPVINVIARSKNLDNTARADSEGAINKFMGLADKYIFDVLKTKDMISSDMSWSQVGQWSLSS